MASKLPCTVGSGQVPVKLVVSPAPALAGHRMALMRPPDGAQDPAVFVCGMQPSNRPLCARVGGGWRARAPGQQQLVCVSPGQHLDSRVVSGEASAAVHSSALSAQGDSSTTKPSAVIIADRSIVERMEPSNSMLPQLGETGRVQAHIDAGSTAHRLVYRGMNLQAARQLAGPVGGSSHRGCYLSAT